MSLSELSRCYSQTSAATPRPTFHYPCIAIGVLVALRAMCLPFADLIRPTVTALLATSRPSHITWLVMPVVIYAVNTVTWRRSRADMLQKCAK